MRHRYSASFRDSHGHYIASGTVAVYLAGTSSAANIYTDVDSATHVHSVTTDSTGRYTFYVDRFDYNSDQTFKIVCSKTGYTSLTIDNITIEDACIQTYTIADDKTVTTDVYAPLGCIYTVATGKTLTFSGKFDGSISQHFTGLGTVAFGTAATKEVYPEWWGDNTTPGTTDMAAPLQAALDSLPASGGTVALLGGGENYLIGTGLTITKKVILYGQGRKETSATACPTTITKAAALDGAGITISKGRCVLRDFSVDGESGNGGDGIVLVENGISLINISVYNQGNDGVRVGDAGVTNANSWFMQFVSSKDNGNHGFYFHSAGTNANAGTGINLEGIGNTADGIYVNNSHANTFVGTLVETNGAYGVHLGTVTTKNVFVGGDLDEANVTKDLYCEAGSSANVFLYPSLTLANTTDSGSNKIFYSDPAYTTLVTPRSTNVSCSNGANNDVALPTSAYARIAGPTGAYNITGFAAGISGQRILLVNGSGQTLTLNYANTGSVAANRLYTSAGADITVTNLGSFEMVYDDAVSRWQIVGV